MFSDDPGDAVRAAVRRATENECEVGLQVCAVVEGELVLNVADGVADQAAGTPVTTESLFPVFSATKGIVAAAAFEALASGDVALDAPIATVWPGMSRDGVTLRQVLTHTAGLPHMPAGADIEAMCDWEGMVAAMESERPLWQPGTKVGYHAYTYGWLVGETLRRAAGRAGEDAGALVRRLACIPAGADDFWIGLPRDLHPRVVTLYRAEPRPSAEGSLMRRAIPPSLETGQEVFGRPDVRSAVLPGAGGIATARALALTYGRLAVLASNAREDDESDLGWWVRTGTRVCEEREDIVLRARVPRGLGFYVSGSREIHQGPPFDGPGGRFGHPGSGGSIAWGDRRLRAGFAITRNRMTTAGWNDPIVRRLTTLVTQLVTEICGGGVTGPGRK